LADERVQLRERMSNEAKYFEVLSGAITQVEEDSFEARGVIYDRLWNIVLQKLQDADQDTPEDLARERAAYLSAVKRIEFGERLVAPPLAGTLHDGALQEAEPGQEAPRDARRPKRPVWRRVAVRMASACVVLAGVWFAYLIVARLDPASAERGGGQGASASWHSRLMDAAISVGNLFDRQPATASGPAQRAVFYEESSGTATGHTFSGRAVWRNQAGVGTASASGTVLSIDAEIPQKKLFIKVSIQRASDGGGAISHFVEFKLSNPDGSASDVVENIVGILMKNDELSPGIELVGKITKVHRGVFLMGLSGAAADLGRNLKLLKERPWLDIPIIMQDKTRGILAIEKGSTGQASVDRALSSWGQT
jgi:hypothetical protein